MIGIFDTLVNSICEASLQKKSEKNYLLYIHCMALDKMTNIFFWTMGFWIFIEADII